MKRLTAERTRRGWSKAELARKSGLNDVTVGMAENGRLLPYPGQLLKLARALEFDGEPAALLEEVEG
jgi:transcriptional regulator with XRE-family HTH domain